MAQYDCGMASTYIVSNGSGQIQSYYYNGQLLYLSAYKTDQVPCTGLIDLSKDALGSPIIAPLTVSIQPYPFEVIQWSQPMSFLIGLLCALAFVSASLRRWI